MQRTIYIQIFVLLHKDVSVYVQNFQLEDERIKLSRYFASFKTIGPKQLDNINHLGLIITAKPLLPSYPWLNFHSQKMNEMPS